MKYTNPRARRYALRCVSPWFLLAFAAAEGGLSIYVGWSPLPAVATAAAVALAAWLFNARYDLIVTQESREAERKAFEAELEASKERLATILATPVGGCPKDCAGCIADQAATDQRWAELLRERAIRHGHIAEDV